MINTHILCEILKEFIKTLFQIILNSFKVRFGVTLWDSHLSHFHVLKLSSVKSEVMFILDQSICGCSGVSVLGAEYISILIQQTSFRR